jgi:hypothetical protein
MQACTAGYVLTNVTTPESIPLSCVTLAGAWLSVYSLGPDPIGNTALALFSGQPFSSNAFFLSCWPGRYQVTSTQAYMSQYICMYVCTIF